MTCLLALPTEIICEIIEYLLPPTPEPPTIDWPLPIFDHAVFTASDTPLYRLYSASSYRVLSALARTCRFLQPLATKVLYQRYEAVFREPLIGFLRQTEEKHNLCQEIRNITVIGCARCMTGLYEPEFQRQEQIQKEIDRLRIPKDSRKLLIEKLKELPVHIELATLILKAPNLASLCVLAGTPDLKNTDGILPLWLTAVLGAMPMVPEIAGSSGVFDRLHTLEVSIGGTFSNELARLFYIPSLRQLFLAEIWADDDDEFDPQDWPVAASSSGIQGLHFTKVIIASELAARLITSCSVLSSCQVHLDDYHCLENPHEYWAVILAALEKYCSTLKKLSIKSQSDFMASYEHDKGIRRIDLFHRLYSLEVLDVPWVVLMGKPNAYFEQFSDLGLCIPRPCWEGHPQMRDVIPPHLRSLTCYIEAWKEPLSFYDDAFKSLLPIDSQDFTSIQSFNCVYEGWDGVSYLPMDFLIIEEDCSKHGVSFNGVIRRSNA